MIISLIIEGIICLLAIISSYLSGKTVHNNKKIKTKLNSIEKEVNEVNNNNFFQKLDLNKIKLKKNDIDQLDALFIEFENKIRELLTKKDKK